jgi:hypothetical protein
MFEPTIVGLPMPFACIEMQLIQVVDYKLAQISAVALDNDIYPLSTAVSDMMEGTSAL